MRVIQGECINLYLQGGCSHPQPISETFDFSAFSQYSLQYFSPSPIMQSQVVWAHLFCFSAIALLPLFTIDSFVLAQC